MVEKTVYDARGRMSNLGRVKKFYPEAFVHLVSYRLLIIFSLLLFVTFALSVADSAFTGLFDVVLVLTWIFFTTQVFETAKGLSLTASRGAAFGRLNSSFVGSMMTQKEKARGRRYRVIPYIVLAVWIAGLIALLAELMI